MGWTGPKINALWKNWKFRYNSRGRWMKGQEWFLFPPGFHFYYLKRYCHDLNFKVVEPQNLITSCLFATYVQEYCQVKNAIRSLGRVISIHKNIWITLGFSTNLYFTFWYILIPQKSKISYQKKKLQSYASFKFERGMWG